MAESYNDRAPTKGNPKSFTTNPRAPRGDDIDEPTGPVAKDSLANESIGQGGAFADNRNPDVLGVRGANSTLNTTDTSAARKLNPADDATSRDFPDSRATTRYPDAQAGQAIKGGVHNADGFVGGPIAGNTTSTGKSQSSTGGGGGNGGTSGLGSRPYVEQAPTYADSAAGNLVSDGQLRPKGDNLGHGTDIPPNRPTFTGDVGGPKDPGRLAEQRFQRENASSGNDAAQARSANEPDQRGAFDVLNPSERA